MTDSVFYVLLACFDESMGSIRGRGNEAWKTWNTVDIMQEQNMNWFDTTLIVVIYFLILTDLTKVLFEFCVIEVFKFWVILRRIKE